MGLLGGGGVSDIYLKYVYKLIFLNIAMQKIE